MNDKTLSHVIGAMEYIHKPIQTIPQPLSPTVSRILDLRGDRHKHCLWTVRRSSMVIDNLLDDVLTNLYSDYFIYLINRCQLSEINIKCSEDVRGQFSQRWRTGITASPRDWSVSLANDHGSLRLVSHHRESLWLVGNHWEVSWGKDYFLILAVWCAVSQLLCA